MALLWILLNVFIGIVSIVFYTQHRRLNYWSYRGLIYDEPSLFRGSIRRCSPTDALRKVYTKFKGCDMAGFFIFLRPAIMILNLDLIKLILSNEVDKFSEINILFERFSEFPVKSIHHKLRLDFNSNKIRELFPIAARGYCDIFEDLIPPKAPAQVEITEIIEDHTADVIGTLIFGKSGAPHRFFKNHSSEKLLTRIKRFLNFSRFRTCDEELFVESIKKCIQNKDSMTSDFITTIFNLQSKRNADIDDVASQSYEYFFTGHHTSSSTISCCIYELAKNEDLQHSLRNEILLALEDNDWQFTYESLLKMRILNKVLNETLRKHTVVPCLVRKANSNFLVESSNFVIEKGTIVIIPVESIHNDPSLFPQPNQFETERFSSEEIQRRNPCAFLPFGDGGRVCIGVRFAKLLCKVALVMLLGRFSFSLADCTKCSVVKRTDNFLNSLNERIFLNVQRL